MVTNSAHEEFRGVCEKSVDACVVPAAAYEEPRLILVRTPGDIIRTSGGKGDDQDMGPIIHGLGPDSELY